MRQNSNHSITAQSPRKSAVRPTFRLLQSLILFPYHVPLLSLEVLLPFLQESQPKKEKKHFKIVPILLRNLQFEECKKVAEALSDFISDDIGIIVSSDFTHYGHNFGYVPFQENVKENLYQKDGKIIEKILLKNSSEVYRLGSNSTVCGVYGLSILTELSKTREWNASKIDYYTTGDITGDWSHVVGYGGLVFE
mgnify:CR=1 FL=1